MKLAVMPFTMVVFRVGDVAQLLLCLVVEHCWDPVGLAILDYRHRFERLPRARRGRR